MIGSRLRLRRLTFAQVRRTTPSELGRQQAGTQSRLARFRANQALIDKLESSRLCTKNHWRGRSHKYMHLHGCDAIKCGVITKFGNASRLLSDDQQHSSRAPKIALVRRGCAA